MVNPLQNSTSTSSSQTFMEQASPQKGPAGATTNFVAQPILQGKTTQPETKLEKEQKKDEGNARDVELLYITKHKALLLMVKIIISCFIRDPVARPSVYDLIKMLS